MTNARTQRMNWKAVLALAAGAALAALFWPLVRAVLGLVAGAAALAFLLAPLCRRLEGALGRAWLPLPACWGC